MTLTIQKEVKILLKKFLLMITLVAAMLVSGCGEVNIGYLDSEKLMDTPQIKTIREEGESKLQEAEMKMIEEITAKQDATDEEKQKVQMEAQRKLMGIQQAYSSQIKQKLDAALADIVKAKNIDIVIDSSEDQKVVFQGGIDLTDEVSKKLQ